MTWLRNSILIVCILILALPDAKAQNGADSQTLIDLKATLRSGDTGALTAFWKKIETNAVPLVEAHPHDDSSRVTFLFRGDPTVSSVRLSSGLNALLIDGIEPDFSSLGTLAQVPETDLWYISFVLGNDIRIPYLFEISGNQKEGAPTEVLDPHLSIEPHHDSGIALK